jgi:hypothetical protein
LELCGSALVLVTAFHEMQKTLLWLVDDTRAITPTDLTSGCVKEPVYHRRFAVAHTNRLITKTHAYFMLNFSISTNFANSMMIV